MNKTILSVFITVLIFCSCSNKNEMIDVDEIISAEIQFMKSNKVLKIENLSTFKSDLNQLKKIPLTKYPASANLVIILSDSTKHIIRTNGINYGPIGSSCFVSQINIIEKYSK
ncbi:MAG: hypothetical protein Q8P20_03735 [bacterium]|nr:hypothetical protein [bacterium]